MREARTAAEIVQEVDTFDKLIPFLEGYFEREPAPGRLYHEKIAEELQKYPHRAQNPAYIRAFVELALMAAAYGFPRNSGHIARHRINNDIGDFTHPLKLLETQRYMGVIGNQAIDIRQSMVDESSEDELSIWSRYVIPVAEKVDETLLRAEGDKVGVKKIQRDKLGLPLLIPDSDFIEFHRQLSRLPLRREDVHTMSKAEFVANVLPMVSQIYTHIPGIEQVFLNEPNWGNKKIHSIDASGF